MSSSMDNLTSGSQDDLLEELAKVNKQRKILEAQEKELRKALGSYFEAAGNARILRGNYLFEMKVSPGRKTLDKEALLAAGIQLAPYYKVGKPFHTLTIKEVA